MSDPTSECSSESDGSENLGSKRGSDAELSVSISGTGVVRSSGSEHFDDPNAAVESIDRVLLRLFDHRAELIGQIYSPKALASNDSSSQPESKVVRAAKQIEKAIDLHAEDRETASQGETQSSHGQPAISREDQTRLLKHLSSVCLNNLPQNRAAFLGPLHSYSHLAALKYFGDAAGLTPVSSIASVFEAVERGEVETGIVPIENSTDGRVIDTLGRFAHSEVEICGEVLLPIHHNLLSTTPLAEINEVQSKPQALSQCRRWLARHLPDARLTEVSSTTAAAQQAARTPGIAAVASIEAGREYELDVLAASIEDNPNNVTRFAVLGRQRSKPTTNDKTSILFQIDHQPGALADAMMIFKNQGLNLTWIESFPAAGKPSEYLFFVELSGHRDQANVASAIQQLNTYATRLAILGSYAKAV